MREGFHSNSISFWLQVTIAKQGGADVILTAMKQHASVAAVQEYGCLALYELNLENAENKVTIANLNLYRG